MAKIASIFLTLANCWGWTEKILYKYYLNHHLFYAYCVLGTMPSLLHSLFLILTKILPARHSRFTNEETETQVKLGKKIHSDISSGP